LGGSKAEKDVSKGEAGGIIDFFGVRAGIAHIEFIEDAVDDLGEMDCGWFFAVLATAWAIF
jgi:hypothetical protein